MSASIYWRPTKVGRRDISPGSPSRFMESLKEAFGSDLPMRLTRGNIATLNGMAAAERGDQRDAFQALVVALHDHEEIEIEAEW